MRRGAARLSLTFAATIIVVGVIWWGQRQNSILEDPFRASAIHDAPFPSLSYSMQAFLWWDDYAASLALHWLSKAQFTHVKQVFAWRDIQPKPDEWHFERGDEIVEEAAEKGLGLIVRLGSVPVWAQPPRQLEYIEEEIVDTPPAAEYLPAWGEYCGAIAKRYAGQVAGYQIWNEPNLVREWGGRPVSAADYIELLRVCSEAIRKQDEAAIIISAGLAPTGTNDPALAIADDVYFRQLYVGDFQRYVDVVGAHAVGFAAPEFSPDDAEQFTNRGRWASFRRIEDLRRIMVEEGDAARQMAILEMGWTTDPRPESQMAWFAVDELTQAEYLRRAFAYAAENWRPWVGLMSLIYSAYPGWTPDDEEFWWSLIRFMGDPKVAVLTPGFYALQDMPKVCDNVACP